jgi:hypothetical protein
MHANPFVNALIAAANQNQAIQPGQLDCERLIKAPALCGKQNHRLFGFGTLAPRRQVQRIHTRKKRFRLEDHAFAAAKRAVIHSTMAIAGVNPQVANLNHHQPRFARPANDAVVQWPAKKIGEDGDEVDLQNKTL